MPTFTTELSGKPNSCIIKIYKQKFHAILDSGAEVSLIHARVYNSPIRNLKLKKKSVFLHW